jgi:peroxiredoxin
MQVAQLRGVVGDIHQLGAELVLVGSGTPAQARAFGDAERLTTPLYTDPSLASFDGFGLERGVASVLRPVALGRAAGALAQGFRQGRVQGAPLQQGGAFVIGTGGEIALSFVSQSPGHHPETGDLLAALRRLIAMHDR